MVEDDPGQRSGKLWGGRFESGPSPELEALSRSPREYFDLVRDDVAGSTAHLGELERVGLIDADLRRRIAETLEQMVADHEAGALQPLPSDEDVHGYLERVLVERLGPEAGAIRAGRSRNDQAANNLRLYLRRTIPRLTALVGELVEALVDRSEDTAGVVAPGFTHLQTAQPILFGHQLLAHAWAVRRDMTRLVHAWEASGLSPLGSAALAGSTLHADQEAMAADLGYRGMVPNSIDAVSSRDHVVDFLYAAAMLGTDVSRLCEELCMWASKQFGWVRLHDGYSTGSSIMPQKKNPDIAELSRGRTGRLHANLIGMLSALKSLAFAYNRDLADDKHYTFDSVETLELVLPALTGMIRTLEFDAEEMRRQAIDGFSLATEVADWLAEGGMPFSEAHDVTGRLVLFCEARGVGLEDLGPADLAEVDERLTPDVLERLTLESAVARRDGLNGTAPEVLVSQQTRLRAELGEVVARFDVNTAGTERAAS
ncbi:argininosuccinate lyase [Leucobacter sp. CSA1]|uniref:Argininosuccinate lyase n=1 Tax=Leucobacter chromiisoli TaxID=2796471 RepID=A0A934UT19_9MICO|nr:argininosuccinate lyase [Leucobacter chromiisoli]MBK0417904.1 argininosuccinate lyase [Leucobacter chromiisoli]